MNHILELQEFFVEGKDHKKSHVLLHIAEPVSATEKERGFFFVVAEINNGYAEQIEALQQIIDDIEGSYYDEQLQDTPSLEEILQNINRRAHHVLKYEDTEISCVVGVIKDQTISLAYHGKPQALLFYPSKETFASVSIIEEEADSTSQLFSELIEGNVNPGDYVLVTSPHLLRFFSADRTRKLLGTRRVEEVASHMQKVLYDLRNEYSFGGLLIHVTDQYDRPKTGKAPKSADKGSAESLEHLMASTKSTEDTLSPPLFAPIGAKLKQILTQKSASPARNTTSKRTHKHYNVETNHRRKPEGQDESLFGKFLIGLGHALVFIGTALTLIFKKVFGALGYIFSTILALVTNRNNGRARTLQSWRNGFKSQKNFLVHLPLTSKIILALTIILGVSFVSSIGYLKVKERREVEARAYTNMVQAITDKKDAAEAALVYNEKSRALVLLQEAKDLLGRLPRESNNQIQKAEDLQKELESFLDELRNLTNVTTETLFEFETPENNPLATRLVQGTNTLAVFNPEFNTLYTYNTLQNSQNSQPLETIKSLTYAAYNRDVNRLYFLTKDFNLASFNLETNALLPEQIAYPKDNTRIAGVNMYNGKLYTLDATNAQIYKHDKTQTGYSKGVEWVTGNSLNFENATSVSVDGNIYVGHADGTVTKLFKGEKQAFETSGLDPALGSVQALWTSSDSDTLYILDSKTKRLVLLNKEGVFKKQFTSSEWSAPSDFTIDEANGVAYLIDSNKLYKFSIK